MKHSHALAALIDEVRAANGWSDPDVVARAARKGHKLSKSNISRIRNNPVVTLNVETVSALADGLGVSKAMVANAALASMGIVTYNSADLMAEEAIKRDPTLGDRDKKMLLAVLAGLRDVSAGPEEESGHHGDRASKSDIQARNEYFHGERPGSDRRDPGSGQKTGRGLSTVPNVERVDTNNHDGGNIPLPDDFEQLAAHPATRSSGRREHEAGRERGEESQENETH